MKALIAIGSAGLTSLALAHEGHGLSGAHWHATDALGYVVLAAIVGIALWAARRK